MLRNELQKSYFLLPAIAKAIFMDDANTLMKLLDNHHASLNYIDLSTIESVFYNKNLRYLSPLTFATMMGSISSIKILLKRGANPYHLAPYAVAKERGYDSIAELLPHCFSGDIFLRQFLLALNYPFAAEIKDGLCYGLGKMARQAGSVNDIKSFTLRLEKMYAIFCEAEESALKKFNLSYENERLFTEQGEYINEELGKEIRRNIALQVHRDEALSIDMHAFCDGLILHHVSQLPDLLNEYFQDYSNAFSLHQRNQLVFELVKPTLLDKEDSLESNGFFTGAYSLEELNTYFHLLENAIKESGFTNTVSFSLIGQQDVTNIFHAIELTYDCKEKTWYFTNISSLPTLPIHSTKQLAELVALAFFTYDCAIFATMPVSSTQEKNKLQTCLEKLWQTEEWVQLHAITPEKINLRTCEGGSWRNLAINIGDPITVMEIDQAAGLFHKWKRSASGAAVGGLLGFGLFGGLLPVIVAAAAGAKITKSITSTAEQAMALKNSLVFSSYRQLPLEQVDTSNNQTGYQKDYRHSFIESWQKTHAPESKIGTMLQNRKKF